MSRWRVRAIPTSATVILVLASSGSAEATQSEDPQRLTITGRILDGVTRSPLEGVRVTFEGIEARFHTDSEGQFEIQDIPTGVYQVEFSSLGYQRSAGNFTVDRSGSFVILLTPVSAESDTIPGRLVGRVVDGRSGQPVGGVVVSIAQLHLNDITNESGRFAMNFVTPGRYAVEFSSLGYVPRIDSVEIVSGNTSTASVRLALDPIEVEPITVTVEPRELFLEEIGFYQRQTIGFGHYIDRAEIETRFPHKITDLFTGLVGVRMVWDPPFGRSVKMRGNCSPTVFVDGIRTDDSIDDLFSPDVVSGIELYRGSAGLPIQYGPAGCAILIWTRR